MMLMVLNNLFECLERLKDRVIVSYRLWNVADIKENKHNKLVLDMLGTKYYILNLYDLAKENNWVKLEDTGIYVK